MVRSMLVTTVLCLAGCVVDSGGDDGGGGDDAGGGDECSAANDLCAGDTICIAGSCEAAFGRVYEVRNVAVDLPTTDPSGESWDVGGGAPDILVEIWVNGALAATTSTVQDQFSATFTGPFEVETVGGGDLLVQAYDEDLTVDDPAFGCTADPLTADLLRSRQLSCSSGGSSIDLRIDPR